MTVSDEAFMLLVLENNCGKWLEADGTKVGRGKYTENAANKKFCGWRNEGMCRFNELNKFLTENRKKQYCKPVEEEIVKTFAETYKSLLGVNRKNSRAKRRHETMQEEDNYDDDSSVLPQDELHLLMA